MKKLVCILLAALMLVCLTACSNENWGFGNYNWTHIHFSDAVEGHCATIKSWHNYEIGIQVHTIEYGFMFLSEGSYIIFESGAQCPYCGGAK